MFTALLGRQCVARTPEKNTGAGGADLHGAFAFLAGDIGHGGLIGPHTALVLLRLLQALAEILVKFVEQLVPGEIALGYLVKVLLHACGKAVIQQVGETLLQALGDDIAHFLGVKALVLQAHVAAVLDRGDNGGIGGGSTDTALFQLPHEAGLTVSRRRLGEMLGGIQLQQRKHVALLQVGQYQVFAALPRDRLYPGKAVELNNAAFCG